MVGAKTFFEVLTSTLIKYARTARANFRFVFTTLTRTYTASVPPMVFVFATVSSWPVKLSFRIGRNSRSRTGSAKTALKKPKMKLMSGVNAEARKAQPATAAQGEEIKRLYQWVVLNLPPAVPADARAFLQQRSA